MSRKVLNELQENNNSIFNNNNPLKGNENLDSASSEMQNRKIIGDDVKLMNEPINIERIIEVKKRKRNPEETEEKRLEEEKYNQEISEKRYKQLMHLLKTSKFYSQHLMKKLNETTESKKIPETNENKEPSKSTPTENKKPISKRRKIGKTKSNLHDYFSSDTKKRIQNNLSMEEIEKELSTDSDTENERKPPVKNNEPKYFKGKLRDYQIHGLEWMKILYENGLNGILADEMGLGKTIQVIALIAHLLEKRQSGPFLIIAPLSTIPNWLMEFENFLPNIPVVLLHGDLQARTQARIKIRKRYSIENGFLSQPIVLTTYEIPMREKSILQSQKWRYIVIDEGHRIKNPDCQLVQLLRTCKSMNRLLLTGTPLQNNLKELWSLLNFLMPEIFHDLQIFESWFDAKGLDDKDQTEKLIKQEKEKQVLSSLREILKPFMLRRIKSDVCLEIPAKKEVVVFAPLTELQHVMYKALIYYRLDKLSEIEESKNLIIDTSDGRRSKRICRQQIYSYDPKSLTYRMKQKDTDKLNNFDEMEDGDGWKKANPADADALNIWKRHATITDENREYFLRLSKAKLTNQWILLKKIVNHPYLIHCPIIYTGRVDEDLIKTSGKILILDAMLKKLKERKHKVLIFSTWTQILDMLEDYVHFRKFKYVRLDGNTSMDDRKENIRNFNEDPDTFIFLITTRAGGVGLNLTGADTVIIYDSDWNPQADIQAMARCHRIGQSKPVAIYKLCTKYTIDELIMKRAESKRILEKIVISKKKEFHALESKESYIELIELLEKRSAEVVSVSEVFTEEELEKLLDRRHLVQ